MIVLMIVQMIFSFIIPFLPIIIPIVVIAVLVWYFYAKIKRFFGGMLARVKCLKNPFTYSKCVKKATRGPVDPSAPKKCAKGKKGDKCRANQAGVKVKGVPPATKGIKLVQPAPAPPKQAKAKKGSDPKPKPVPIAKAPPPPKPIVRAPAPCPKGNKGDQCRKDRRI
jgi:hypothetical protein